MQPETRGRWRGWWGTYLEARGQDWREEIEESPEDGEGVGVDFAGSTASQTEVGPTPRGAGRFGGGSVELEKQGSGARLPG